MRKLICVALLTTACTHLKFPEVPEYKLSKSGPFIISESPNLWKFFERRFSGVPNEKVDLIVKNADAKEHQLEISKAVVKVNKEISPLSCKTIQNTEGPLVLKPGTLGRVQCMIELVPNAQNELANKDSIVRVEIPSDGAPLVAERMFRIEGFQ